MDSQTATCLALVSYVVFLGLAFGLRGWLQYRRTGSTGYVGLSGKPGSLEWLGGALFAVALVAVGLAPVLQGRGWIPPLAGLDHDGLRAAGAGIALCGIVVTLWAQIAMGDSWRIGVDARATTALVASGPFRWVRNPIFSAMGLACMGLTALTPNLVAIAGLGALFVAIEIQVRCVEEPYLARVHGVAYAEYRRRTGRFLPRPRLLWLPTGARVRIGR